MVKECVCMIKSKPAKEARTKRRITRVDVERMLILCAVALGGAVPSAAGFLAGMFFLRATDALLARVQGRTLNGTEKMLLAVTLHNLPEGMAVGAVGAGALYGSESPAAALALALGIALQNVPEGAIVSLPLRAAGVRRGKAFLGGVLSGAVEPPGAALLLLAAGVFLPLLPWMLAFAAGAMLCVIVEELIPGSARDGGHSTAWFALGFTVMMLLDVWLG